VRPVVDVVFVVPPFADICRPAIGVSLLEAAAVRDGYSATIEYCNLDLAETIGVELYNQIAGALPAESLAGEWFFADVVFGDAIPDPDEYVRRVLRNHTAPATVARIVEARACRHAFVRRCADAIRAKSPRIVGFTTTFHQTCASLAIARCLKEDAATAPLIVFGGANCEDEMGEQLARSFPCIDYVCGGEGDLAFPELLRALTTGAAVAVPGICDRNGPTSARERPQVELDALPVPAYADYFARIERSPVRASIDPAVLIETSRGCWWGAKHHCTFCGLNGGTMAFRSKSPERVLDEMRTLARTYGVTRMDSVDNILDMRYVRSVFPVLAAENAGIELFFEVKANLRYDQLRVLRAGGITAIQPGIESLSSEVLRLMRKGCTALQNIALLRWCGEISIIVAWNLLGGFPEEPMTEYARMEALLPSLAHLEPPTACAPIRLDRFSPYAESPDDFGMLRVRPAYAYYFVYPLERRELARLAYFFDFDYGDARKPMSYLEPLMLAVGRWKRAHADPEARPVLDAFEGDDGTIRIRDSRPGFGGDVTLDGVDAGVFARCDTIRTLAALATEYGADEARAAVERLRARGLVIEDEGHYLSLAVFRTRARGSDGDVATTPAAQPLLRAGGPAG
jgi:ribosomal peptide maturation radical SAM protein 1